MLTVYRIFLYAIFPVVMLKLLFRAIQSPQYFVRIPQRFGFSLSGPGTHQSPPGGIWIHAVSVGEVNAAIPLINKIITAYPGRPVTVTTMTPTGSERVRQALGCSVFHCYLPYDYPGAMKRFLDTVQPGVGMVMETEVWPNMISECHRRNIPLVYTNVRMSARSYRGYQRFRFFFRKIFNQVDQFAVQARMDAGRLIDLGVDAQKIRVTGNIKFEVVLPASMKEASQSVRRDLGWERPVWVVGSTHEGEEARVLEAFAGARKEIPDLLLVLVPRHPERFAAVFRLCRRLGYRTVQRSQHHSKVSSDTDIYVGDTMGDLSMLLCAGDLAFMGGSLVPTGGHNLLEACAAGVAVVFGPHMFNFQEISNLVLSGGAGVQVLDSAELSEVVVRLFQDPGMRDQYGSAGKAIIEANRGALARILEMLHTCCPAEPRQPEKRAD